MTLTDDPSNDRPSPTQLRLAFPKDAATFETLAETPSNSRALALARQPDLWPGPAVCIYGPPRCGLSSLAEAFARRFFGRVLTGAEVDRLGRGDLEAQADAALAIDQADAIRRDSSLLTLLNRAAHLGHPVLLTAHLPPQRWQVSQPDLLSRLRAMMVAEIASPDEAMVAIRLERACQDRYFALTPEVATYLTRRLPRDYEVLEQAAEAFANATAGTGRRLTIPVARDVLRAAGVSIDPDEEEAGEADE